MKMKRALGLAMMVSVMGYAPPTMMRKKDSASFQKECKQCGKKYSHRGKICADCFEENGGKLKKEGRL